jgi:basic membrane lipoprotein Med (substrate-binding protein (PBP1-ABC) superfamily)/DNA-binding SARP family transcriptional activator
VGDAHERLLFRVLGSVQVELDGRNLALGPPRQRAVLGVLLLHHGEVVSTARLVEALWGTTPPRTAGHSLQTYVSGLRSILGAERITTRAPGYVLNVDEAELDVGRFEQLVDEGIQALATHDPASAAERLGRALSWWRGDPLADLAAELTQAGELARLEALHLTALENWSEAQLALGHHETVLPELERLTRDHPLRERLWGQRMLALYRAGRGAEALRAYQELRETLAVQLGADPSPELATLFERMLVHDPHLGLVTSTAPPTRASGGPVRNPYKGLRPFTEVDSPDFFGRDDLVRDMLAVLTEPGRSLLAVVGPSGSGKSSAVAAGLVPALRRGELPGCADPLLATMLPGDDPVGRLEEALGVLERPPTMSATDLRSVQPSSLLTGRPRVLVIDQLEELFTLHRDSATHRRFLEVLDRALASYEDLHVVVTLRADCFDQPLYHPELGRRITTGTVVVLPLTTEQLAAAATGPAHGVGVEVEPALVAALVADLADQPGALPLFQYALTELFERRRDDRLSVEAYRAVGGVDGAVSRRAEELYSRLTPEEQTVAQQLFLRLVQPGGRGLDNRRRVAMAEIAALDVDPLALQHVLERFVRARMLSVDRDSRSGTPTVEMAHDALLGAWARLRSWIEDAREDLERRVALANAIAEWRRAGEDPDYLLRGARLADHQRWASSTTLRLSTPEQRYLEASTTHREREEAAELARERAEQRLRTRARRRLWGLAAATAALLALGGAIGWAVLVDVPLQVALVYEGSGHGDRGFGDLFARGLTLIDRTFDVRTEEVVPLTAEAGEIRELCDAGTDLVFLGGWTYLAPGMEAAADCPDTLLVMMDASGLESAELPGNLLSVTFATEEGSFLAGAVAALSTTTDVVGFVGGVPTPIIDRFRAGFEAGVHHVDPAIEVLAIYLTDQADPETGFSDAFWNQSLGRMAGRQLYDARADVVFVAAGVSGHGVAEAARELSDPTRHLWVIGVDSDWSVTQPAARQPYVLTSVLKRMDLAMLDTMRDFAAGQLTSTPRRYGLREDAVQLSSEGHGPEDPQRIDDLRRRIAAGELHVPHVPTGPTLPTPTAAFPPASAEITFTGDACRYQGPTQYVEGTVLEIEATNTSDDVASVIAFETLEPPPRWTGPTVDREPPSWVDRWSAVVVEVRAGDRSHAGFVGGAGTAVVVCQTTGPETGTTLTWRGAEITILPR